MNVRKACDFKYYYELLRSVSSDPSLTQKVKQIMLDEFLEEWRKYAHNPRPGKKDVAGRPLEKAIRSVIRQELDPLDTTVSTKQFLVWEDVRVIPDVIIEKKTHPISMISIKSWIGTTQLRETFGKAYFAKTWHGQKNVRVYMLTLQPLQHRLQGLINICKPYIDEVYSLSGKPYFDELVAVLKETYKD